MILVCCLTDPARSAAITVAAPRERCLTSQVSPSGRSGHRQGLLSCTAGGYVHRPGRNNGTLASRRSDCFAGSAHQTGQKDHSKYEGRQADKLRNHETIANEDFVN
jgi:hypothetical protein